MKKIQSLIVAVICIAMTSCGSSSFNGYWMTHCSASDSFFGVELDGYYKIKGKKIQHTTILYGNNLIIQTGYIKEKSGNPNKGKMVAVYTKREIFSTKKHEVDEVENLSQYKFREGVLYTGDETKYVKIKASEVPDFEALKASLPEH